MGCAASAVSPCVAGMLLAAVQGRCTVGAEGLGSVRRRLGRDSADGERAGPRAYRAAQVRQSRAVQSYGRGEVAGPSSWCRSPRRHRADAEGWRHGARVAVHGAPEGRSRQGAGTGARGAGFGVRVHAQRSPKSSAETFAPAGRGAPADRGGRLRVPNRRAPSPLAPHRSPSPVSLRSARELPIEVGPVDPRGRERERERWGEGGGSGGGKEEREGREGRGNRPRAQSSVVGRRAVDGRGLLWVRAAPARTIRAPTGVFQLSCSLRRATPAAVAITGTK